MPMAVYSFLEEYDFGAKPSFPSLPMAEAALPALWKPFPSFSRGYQSFVVNYRLRPYTQGEGALDLARAVRFVRKNADVYGIDESMCIMN